MCLRDPAKSPVPRVTDVINEVLMVASRDRVSYSRSSAHRPSFSGNCYRTDTRFSTQKSISA